MKRMAMVLVALLVMVTLVSSAMLAESPANATVSQDRLSTILRSEDGLVWQVGYAYGGATLRVSGPDGWSDEAAFGANATLRWQVDASKLADGRYQYELRFAPLLSAAAQAALDAAPERPERELVVAQLLASGEMPESMPVISEGFVVREGALLLPVPTEQDAEGGGEANVTAQAERDLAATYNEDVYVVGGLCVGVDCDGSESFYFITMHLKEDNTRLRFTDSSDIEGYPTRDWELVANESNNYGADYFAIRDLGRNSMPLLIEGNAPNNALRIVADGSVGIGESSPEKLLHMRSSNDPTIRLEQHDPGGWGSYTWDLRANESWFAVRDAVIDTQPFRVYPGQADDALVLRHGRVGLGLESPAHGLHIYDGSDYPAMVVDHNSVVSATIAVTETQTLVGSLSDHPVVLMAGYDPESGETGGALTLDIRGAMTVTAGADPTMQLDANGNMVLSGALTEASDVNRKEHFAEVDGEAVLAALTERPISTWNYIGDDPSVRHMGPMAQDFYAAFGLGADETHLAPLDVNGVTLAALQAQNRQIAALEAENAELGARLDQLETLVAELLADEE